MILGKNLVLALNGTPLAAAKSCSVQQSQSFLPVSSPTSGRSKKYLPGMTDWTISADMLANSADAYNMLDAAWRSGTELIVRFYDTTYGINKTGKALIQNLNAEGSVGSLARFSVTLQGSDSFSTYGGTAITTTLQIRKEGYYIVIQNGEGNFIEGENGLCELRTFTLSARSLVKIKPEDCLLILTTDQSIEQPFDDGYPFNLNNYGCTTYTELTELWLDAGTYCVIFSYEDDTTETPEILKLS